VLGHRALERVEGGQASGLGLEVHQQYQRFPAPFGPSRPNSSPRSTAKLIPRTASTSLPRPPRSRLRRPRPDRNVRVSSVTSMMDMRAPTRRRHPGSYRRRSRPGRPISLTSLSLTGRSRRPVRNEGFVVSDRAFDPGHERPPVDLSVGRLGQALHRQHLVGHRGRRPGD